MNSNNSSRGGAGGAAAISVWKSLSAEHELHMADMDPLAAGLYLVPADRRLIIPRGEAPDYTGLDVIIVRDGKIAALYVFLDSMPS